MDLFEQTLFNFYIEPENFKTAVEVDKYLPVVKRQLLVEFWIEVRNEIEELIRKAGSDWNLYMSEDIFAGYSKISLDNKLWYEDCEPVSPFQFRWSNLTTQPIWGIHNNLNSKKWDIKAMHNRIQKLPETSSYNIKHDWWALGSSHTINFNNYKDVELILPANRSKLVTEFSNTLFELANSYGDVVTTFLADYRYS